MLPSVGGEEGDAAVVEVTDVMGAITWDVVGPGASRRPGQKFVTVMGETPGRGRSRRGSVPVAETGAEVVEGRGVATCQVNVEGRGAALRVNGDGEVYDGEEDCRITTLGSVGRRFLGVRDRADVRPKGWIAWRFRLCACKQLLLTNRNTKELENYRP